MIYTNHHFPCLVSYGPQAEDPNNKLFDTAERYNCIARNALRHITYGLSLRDSKILTWENFSALFIRRNDQLFRALRHEFQNMFYNAYKYVTEGEMDQQAEERLIISTRLLLAMYAFLDPSDHALLKIPQKIASEWHLIDYVTERIDISPQKGPISKLISRKDCLYAYGLVPRDNSYPAPTFLSIPGSAYPTAPGAKINWLFNFFPLCSVGEAHDFSLLDHWIKTHTNITAVGHSKGGTVAMILSALYPQQIKNAEALCPTALDNMTYKRIISKWDAISDNDKPIINVYWQDGDPVFYFGKKFFPGTNVYLVNDTKGSTSKFAAHAQTIVGRESVNIVKLSGTEACFRTPWRDFLTLNKQALNWVIFPLLYSALILSLSTNRLSDFCRAKLGILLLDAFLTGFCLYTFSNTLGASLPLNLCLASGLAVAHVATKYTSRGSKITSNLALGSMLALVFVATIAAVAIAFAARSSLGIFNFNRARNNSNQSPDSQEKIVERKEKQAVNQTTQLILTTLNPSTEIKKSSISEINKPVVNMQMTNNKLQQESEQTSEEKIDLDEQDRSVFSFK